MQSEDNHLNPNTHIITHLDEEDETQYRQDLNNNNNSDVILTPLAMQTSNEANHNDQQNDNHLLSDFEQYENNKNEQMIQQIEIQESDNNDKQINNNSNNPNESKNVDTNEYKNNDTDKDNNDKHKDYVLQLQKEQKYENDPLTQMPYSILPKEMIPKPVRSLIGHKPKYVKKGYINIPYHLGSKFSKINGYQVTFKRAKYNIDHIFCDFPVFNIINETFGEQKKVLSDHVLVVSQFSDT